MKILLTSDTHLYNDYLKRIIYKYKDEVDMMIHCGDSSLPLNHELIKPFDIVVKGNHDDADFPIYQTYQNICVTHGHIYHVYKGYDELIQLCQKENCFLCFHGHTHVPTVIKKEGILFINPGSLMMNRGSYGYGTYAIVEIHDKKIKTHFYHHETDELCPYSIIEEGYQLLEEFKQIA